MNDPGTPRELRPVAEQVLAWVAQQRKQGYGVPFGHLRRIELCALATIEAAMFHDLYGGGTYGSTPEVPEQRGSSSSIPCS